MPLYIERSGDLDRCHASLTDGQTLKDRATQLLLKSKSGALVTQLSKQSNGSCQHSICNIFNTPSESLDRHPCSSRNSDASRSGGILFSNFMSLGFQGLSVVNTLSPNRQGKLNKEHPLM